MLRFQAAGLLSHLPGRLASSAPSFLQRKHIGIFGGMNVGKSTLMNKMTLSPTSIVDSTPGTTADVKQTIMEMHTMGPIRIFDTAGIDELGILGEKKKEKSLSTLKQSDLVVLVIDPYNQRHTAMRRGSPSLFNLSSEAEVVETARRLGKELLVVFNVREHQKDRALEPLVKKILKKLRYDRVRGRKAVLVQDLHEEGSSEKVVRVIEGNFAALAESASFYAPSAVLPPSLLDATDTKSKAHNSSVFLNIPMDDETPGGRLLRPQALTQEQLLRRFVNTFAYRMDLGKARSPDKSVQEQERGRFSAALSCLKGKKGGLKLLVTDSQAIDIVHPWTRKDATPITTFSIMMANFLSGGRLRRFAESATVIDSLKPGDKVLVCEACNHNRIGDDIGIVQIPKAIEKRFGKGVIKVEFSFGREFEGKTLSDYKLILHCGGCMLDQQRMCARLDDLEKAGVPVTNYGVFMSYMQSTECLARVLRPWGIELDTL